MLKEQKCVPCENFGIQPLTREEAKALLTDTPHWILAEDAHSIHRDFQFKGFKSVMFFVNAVAFMAEQEGHHPDLKLGYNYCAITYATHSIKGLSKNDFICAAKIDQLLGSVS
jgi:4a-hydroxytetrahydrobiopterin dehydratase